MVISVAPIVASFLDSKSVYSVIMQTEIEDDSSNETHKFKKEVTKEFCHPAYSFTFIDSGELAAVKLIALKVEAHCQTFYPTVPTPPPNV
ncbi:MAG: hypothetical protein JWN56_1861 [Sphingobacteriales bacterium]|nr:hypothetical protein [Sphingobacteriales bacterium]